MIVRETVVGGGGRAGALGNAGDAGVGESAAQQGADAGSVGGVSADDLQAAGRGQEPEGPGPVLEGRGCSYGTWLAACAFRWEVRGTRTAATRAHTDVRMSATFARVRASRGARAWLGDD